MKLQYTPEAIKDMQEIKSYISKTLHNPSAANRIVKKILDSCGRLKNDPKICLSLMEKIGTETELRCIISGNYLIIYKEEVRFVRVARVLDGRTDYVRVLYK